MDWVLRIVGWAWATLGAWDFWLRPTPSSFLDGMLMFILPGLGLAGLGSLIGVLRGMVAQKIPVAEAPKGKVATE